MIDPVISLSRLKETIGEAHDEGAGAARDRLNAAIASETEKVANVQTGSTARADGFMARLLAPGYGSRMRMAGALAMTMVAITIVANQFSAPASGNADEIAARARAQTEASLAVVARLASHERDERAKRRAGQDGVTNVTQPLIVPPVGAPDSGNQEPDDPAVTPIDEPTAPVSKPTDDEENTDDEDPTTEPEPGTEEPADEPPAGGESVAPGAKSPPSGSKAFQP